MEGHERHFCLFGRSLMRVALKKKKKPRKNKRDVGNPTTVACGSMTVVPAALGWV